MKLRTLATGTDAVITTDPDPAFALGYLFSAGALVRRGDGLLFEYRGGGVTPLGGVFGFVATDGEWAAWSTTAQVIRRDLATGTNVVVFGSNKGFSVDVGANGDVVFLSGFARLYHDGALTIVSTDPGSPYQIATDGVNVTYAASGGTSTNLVLDSGWSNVVLTQNPTAYRLNAGWIAWSTSAAPVQRRSPAGVVEQVSPESGALLDALGPDGTVVYRAPRNGGRYYLVTPAGTRYDLGPAGDLDAVVVHGSSFFLLSGGSAYRLAP